MNEDARHPTDPLHPANRDQLDLEPEDRSRRRIATEPVEPWSGDAGEDEPQ